jgi:SAM-dependent methyltransferase
MTHANELSPPEWLAALAGGDSSFSEVGREFANHLVELCALEPSGSVLDVGCGAGRIAIALTSYLSGDGRYDGFDVLPWAIEWCQKEVTSRFPNFAFQLADVFSEQYYPEGRLRPEEYTFPVADGSYDVACVSSVFTHMPPEAVDRYLSEISRALRPGGRGLMTFYLLNDESRAAIEAGEVRDEFRFRHPVGTALTSFQDAPEWAVAHPEERVRQACVERGLRTHGSVRGGWSGREDYLSWQDILVVERAAY